MDGQEKGRRPGDETAGCLTEEYQDHSHRWPPRSSEWVRTETRKPSRRGREPNSHSGRLVRSGTANSKMAPDEQAQKTITTEDARRRKKILAAVMITLAAIAAVIRSGFEKALPSAISKATM